MSSDDYEDIYRDHIAEDADEAEFIDEMIAQGKVQCLDCGKWFIPDEDLRGEDICDDCYYS